MSTTKNDQTFKLCHIQIEPFSDSPFALVVTVNMVDFSIQYTIAGGLQKAVQHNPKLPAYVTTNSRITLERIITVLSDMYLHQIKATQISPAIQVIDTLLMQYSESASLFKQNDLLPGNRKIAFDYDGAPLRSGDHVLCLDDRISGDTDDLSRLELSAVYEVDSVHDEEHLITPMLVIKNFDGGPVFANRFRLA